MLEKKIDDQEASLRGESLIISGRELPSMPVSENCSILAHNLTRGKLKLSIHEDEICTAHRIGRPLASQRPDKQNILVKMRSDDIVQEVVRSSKK